MTNETRTIGNVRFDFDSRDGWTATYIPNGDRFDILEGISFGGHSTSDIGFLFKVTDEGYDSLVNFTFGITDDDVFEYLSDDIEDYEKTGKVLEKFEY